MTFISRNQLHVWTCDWNQNEKQIGSWNRSNRRPLTLSLMAAEFQWVLTIPKFNTSLSKIPKFTFPPSRNYTLSLFKKSFQLVCTHQLRQFFLIHSFKVERNCPRDSFAGISCFCWQGGAFTDTSCQTRQERGPPRGLVKMVPFDLSTFQFYWFYSHIFAFLNRLSAFCNGAILMGGVSN